MSLSRTFMASPAPRFFYLNTPRKNGVSPSPEIFKIDQLEKKLATIIEEKDEDESDFGYKKIRFLLDTSHEFHFGREGTPSRRNNIPAHFQLSPDNSCITAGNLFYDKSDRIAKITHKSGDFRPTYQSLQFALFKMLEDHRFKFADEIRIESLYSSGQTEKTYTYKLNDLVDEITRLKEESKLLHETMSMNQEHSRKRLYDDVCSSPSRVVGGSIFTPSATRFVHSESPCAFEASRGKLSIPTTPPHSSRVFSAVTPDASPASFRRRVLFDTP